METFEAFLDKLKLFKTQYATKQLNINISQITTLIMAGAFDSLCTVTPDYVTRLKMIELVKKVASSKAVLAVGKKGAIGLAEIDSEFTRMRWLSSVNPTFQFRISDRYSSTLAALGFKATGATSIPYKKENLRIHSSYSSVYDERCLRPYMSKSAVSKPGIVALYLGYETKTWGEGKKLRKLKFTDGSEEFEVVMWPNYGTNDEFDNKLTQAMYNYRRKVCLVIGKPGNHRGYKTFTLQELIALDL